MFRRPCQMYLAANSYLLSEGHDDLHVCHVDVTSGQEGKNGKYKEFLADYEIAQVQVFMRHGARSNHHQIPNYINPHNFSCELQGSELEASLDFPYFLEAVDEDTGLTLPIDGNPKPSWNPETGPDGKSCKEPEWNRTLGKLQGGGVLLPKGVRQMLDFGNSLQKSYGPFLGSLSPDEVYVRAMQRPPRVFLSAASFLKGLIGGSRAAVEQLHEGNFKIHIHSNEKEEPMESSSGVCARGDQLYNGADKKSFILKEQVVELGKLFNVSDFSPHCKSKDPDIADVAITSVCDGGELPCGPGNQCISHELQVRLQRSYDKKWYEQTAGRDGGLEASQLIMYPLLKELVDGMSAEPSSRPKLKVYAGRDGVIGPVAAALGFSVGKWPPFSAHIVFELWEPKSVAGSAMVRVLYDGKDVTSKVVGCGGGALCPLESLKSALQKFLSPFATHEEACMLIPDHAEVV